MTNQKGILSSSTTISKSKDSLSAQVEDELVLMSIEKGNYYGLDPIATDIWNRLEQPIIIGELCAHLADEYDADLETIARDVVALLEQFYREGFIEILA